MHERMFGLVGQPSFPLPTLQCDAHGPRRTSPTMTYPIPPDRKASTPQAPARLRGSNYPEQPPKPSPHFRAVQPSASLPTPPASPARQCRPSLRPFRPRQRHPLPPPIYPFRDHPATSPPTATKNNNNNNNNNNNPIGALRPRPVPYRRLPSRDHPATPPGSVPTPSPPTNPRPSPVPSPPRPTPTR